MLDKATLDDVRAATRESIDIAEPISDLCNIGVCASCCPPARNRTALAGVAPSLLAEIDRLRAAITEWRDAGDDVDRDDGPDVDESARRRERLFDSLDALRAISKEV